jgi:choline-glycine betaine transporter
MTFLRGLWHGLKVLGAALYAILTIGLIWAGLAQLGSAPRWGWACLAVVLAVFAARGLIHNRGVEKGASYVIAAGAYLAFLLLAAAIA